MNGVRSGASRPCGGPRKRSAWYRFTSGAFVAGCIVTDAAMRATAAASDLDA